MKEHFCPAEKSMITYQGECSWCGESEGSMTQEAEQIMKRCQVGTRSYEEANNLHAECYRVIGRLLAQPKQESDDTASILACRDMLDAQPVPPRTTG